MRHFRTTLVPTQEVSEPARLRLWEPEKTYGFCKIGEGIVNQMIIVNRQNAGRWHR